jgi:hypothetical protein
LTPKILICYFAGTWTFPTTGNTFTAVQPGKEYFFLDPLTQDPMQPLAWPFINTHKSGLEHTRPMPCLSPSLPPEEPFFPDNPEVHKEKLDPMIQSNSRPSMKTHTYSHFLKIFITIQTLSTRKDINPNFSRIHIFSIS